MNNTFLCAKNIVGDIMYNSIKENIDYLRNITSSSADFTVRELVLPNSENSAIITTEGMCDKESLAITVINPLLKSKLGRRKGEELFDYIVDNILSASEVVRVNTFDEVINFSMSGFAVLVIDGSSRMLAIGVQGFAFRSVSEPESELVQRGSREGFTEACRVNMTLIRRRIKNPQLVFETKTIGSISNTEICLVYLKNKATSSSVEEL